MELKTLTVAEIQIILNIGRRQAYELVKSGAFPIIRKGRSIRVDFEIFSNWMKGTLT